MTVDEEISQLEDALRRLKIEYDVFFGGGKKTPPTELEWRVQALIKKYSDNGSKMTYPQRFRYNAIAQRHALFSDLWRQKLKIKEEGYRRPSDAALGITGLRPVSDSDSDRKANFVLDTTSDDRQVEAIYREDGEGPRQSWASRIRHTGFIQEICPRQVGTDPSAIWM